jgi:RHS repeat-associated protein
VAKDPLERHAIIWTPVHADDTTVFFNSTGGTGSPVMFVKTLDARSNVVGATLAGDTGAATIYEVHYGANQWLVLPNESQALQSVTSGTFVGATVLAHGKITYDAAGHGLPMVVQKETSTRVFATASLTYDAYGNVATRTRPNQVALGTNGKSRSYVYDALGLHVAAEIDELGHRVEHDWDAALGLEVEVRGPQQGSVMPHEHTTYDGLGRPLTRTRLKNVGNSAPTEMLVFYAGYSDTPDNHVAITQSRTDYTNSAWQQVTTTLDALGRTIKEARATSATTAEVTSRRYDAAGNLVEVDAPNPAGPSPATVAYTYGYDALGRVTKQTSPAHSSKTIQYSPVYTTETEHPTDGSVAVKRVTGRDAFGRLISVSEGVTTRATAGYAYDGLDRVRHIVDGDGVMTDIVYWLSGERAKVTRAGSALVYQYDPDGNMIALSYPRPATVSATDPAWISTWSYDALDRVVVSTPATRDLSPADQARYLANVATLYTYDEPTHANGVGQLTTVTYPFGTVGYDYSIEGWVSAETRSLHVAPDGTTLTATGKLSTTLYTPFGAPQIVTYPDDPTYATSSRVTYDLQGRPGRLDVGQNGNNFQVGIATWTRNAAGLVATRTSSTGSLTTVDQTFAYDASGRNVGDVVNGLLVSGGTSGVLAGETMIVGQDGNVHSVLDRASGRRLTFTYDDLEQLATATSSASDYTAAFGYSPGGKLIAANVQSPIAGVATRNVLYDFKTGDGAPFVRPDLADPAAVRQLTNPDGTSFATFAYDESSNLRSKSVGSATSTFAYDGDNRLREAKTPAGDEVYFYDRSGDRILTYRPAANGQAASLRHRFGGTEITVDTTGARTSTTDIALGAHPAARVTNHDVTKIETLFHGVLGNLLAVLDGGKVVRARYSYGPFGEVLSASGPDAAAFDHTYEDKARDALTQLSYYGARYYDLLTATWTQLDPLFRALPDAAGAAPRNMALFTFSLNNPMRYVDPDGRGVDEVEEDEAAVAELVEDAEAVVDKVGATVDAADDTLMEVVANVTEAAAESGVEDGPIEELAQTSADIAKKAADLQTQANAATNAGQRVTVLQSGGNTLKQSTVDALNKFAGTNFDKGMWKQAVEALKDGVVPPDYHGKIMSNAEYWSKEGREVLGNLIDYLP